MEGLSAVVRTTPHEHVQERIVEQSVYVVVPPIMEGISAVEPEARIEVRTQISQACQQSWEIRVKWASTQELFQSWPSFPVRRGLGRLAVRGRTSARDRGALHFKTVIPSTNSVRPTQPAGQGSSWHKFWDFGSLFVP